jgi:enamine deaminase RidA (YjgF/YER057c/UK114 family)
VTFDILNPESLPAPRGWNHGLLAPAGGRMLFVAGQTAMDRSGRITGGFAEQFARALDAVLEVVRAAGGQAECIGRMTVYVSDMAAYRSGRREVGAAWRERMGRHFPAMALVEVSSLVDEGAVVEIEATAVLS